MAAATFGAALEAIDAGGGPHVTELVLDHDDPDNPVSPGCLVVATVWRSAVGGAGKASRTIVVSIDLAFAQRPETHGPPGDLPPRWTQRL